MRLLAALCACAALSAASAQAAGSDPPYVYSIRTEHGSGDHTITTVAFPVRVGGNVYLCVISEDSPRVYGGSSVALAQSCDFGVSR